MEGWKEIMDERREGERETRDVPAAIIDGNFGMTSFIAHDRRSMFCSLGY
jgi:hypothetical protein